MKPAVFAVMALFATSVWAQEADQRMGSVHALVSGELISIQSPTDTGPAVLQQFRLMDGEWTHSGTQPLEVTERGFGHAVELDGDVLAISSPGSDNEAGAVHLFRRTEEGWQAAGVTTGSDSLALLGLALDLHGGQLVMGAPGRNVVHVVDGAGADESTHTTLSGSDTAEGDLFGSSVATDGKHIYVGAPGRGDYSGAVYVFAPSEDGYAEVAILEAEGHVGFGSSLQTLASGRVLATAPGLSMRERRARFGQQAFNMRRNAVAGPIFELNSGEDGQWTQHAVVDSIADRQAAMTGRVRFAADGDHMVLARGRDLVAYTRSDDGWSQTAQTEAADNESGLGSALAMADGQIATVARGANYGLGALVFMDTDLSRTGRAALLEEVNLTRTGTVDCTDGRASHFGCGNVDLLSFVPISDLGGAPGARLNDVWGWTDEETGKEYALVGRSNGTSFVDITDPALPVTLGDLPLTDGANPSTWRDIKVYNEHAFIVADGAGPHGMQVFDLRQLRDVGDPPAAFEALTTYTGVGSAHNIVINEDTGYAFIVGAGGSGESCGGGLHMVNIHDPANPVFEGCFADEETGRRGTGYSHDAQCVIYHGPDTDHSGKEICFNSNETALSIADVTDKANPVALSNASYPNVAYAHQGWLTDDHAFFYMNDELDELGGEIEGTRTLMWDVADLDDPQYVGAYFSGNPSSDHNLYIKGNLMYQSNYASGLRIVDISDLHNPVEVGFFDTISVIPDAPGFSGSWSNYPYFESGTVIVTSGSEGLFLVKKREVDL